MQSSRIIQVMTALSASLLTACGGDSSDSATPGGLEESVGVVDVTAIYDAAADEHRFVTSTDTVAAGWTTFRFTNASPMLHFVFLDHLPGDRTSIDLLAEVSPVFQESMDLTIAGRPDEAAAAFTKLPEWFGGLVFRGGPGFTSPGYMTEAWLYLEPGNYVLECYVKTPEGVFHWNLGMYADLHVTEEVAQATAPESPTLQITLTDSGMVVEGEASRGEHLVAVHFQEANPGLYGKDIHVARLDRGSGLEELVTWMDASQVEGLSSTAENPAPATFIGGVQDMPFGNTAYFKLVLEPGEYVWISELPAAAPLFQTFTVLE
jgi:hypothetical protein